jgi:hypothetical protein
MASNSLVNQLFVENLVVAIAFCMLSLCIVRLIPLEIQTLAVAGVWERAEN